MIAIATRNLKKKYGKKIAVADLNLTVAKGELLSLLGINGAGKTTTIKMLSCLVRPTEGDAELLGDSILNNPQAVKAKINVSPQETAVAPNLTVRENLMTIAEIYGYDKEEAGRRAKNMMEKFGLDEVDKSRAKTLSGGYMRRLSIAMALITDPKILFLDEPTLGLDVIARRELWRLLRELKGKMTIILTTHYMEEAEALSDRIAVLSKGRLVAVGTAQELLEKTGTGNIEDAFIALSGEGGKGI